jgi:hypothetical protein
VKRTHVPKRGSSLIMCNCVQYLPACSSHASFFHRNVRPLMTEEHSSASSVPTLWTPCNTLASLLVALVYQVSIFSDGCEFPPRCISGFYRFFYVATSVANGDSDATLSKV